MRRSTIVRLLAGSRVLVATVVLLTLGGGSLVAAEPDPKSYWDVDDIRTGMKGVGQTVMVGTKLEEFGAEVLGVMRGVSPGRDMILCRFPEVAMVTGKLGRAETPTDPAPLDMIETMVEWH